MIQVCCLFKYFVLLKPAWNQVATTYLERALHLLSCTNNENNEQKKS